MASRDEFSRSLKEGCEHAFLRVKGLDLAQVGHLLDAVLDTSAASFNNNNLLTNKDIMFHILQLGHSNGHFSDAKVLCPLRKPS
ncbi:MAG: hypothetical protein ACXWCW_06150 [Burkholderiales bacterium]